MAKSVRRTRKGAYKIWIKALRSGNYRQGSGSLRSSGHFCCLGVLCDLVQKDGGPDWSEDRGWGHEFLGDPGKLPKIISKWMGLDPVISSRLVSMNDKEGKTFKEIADYIENIVMPKVFEQKTTV